MSNNTDTITVCDNCGFAVVSDGFNRPTWTHLDPSGDAHYRCTSDGTWGGEIMGDCQATVDGEWDVPVAASPILSAEDYRKHSDLVARFGRKAPRSVEALMAHRAAGGSIGL